MILVIGISPIVLIILGAVLVLNLPVAAVIALVAITAVSLMGSLAICAAIASKTSVTIPRDPAWTYTINRAYRTEAPVSYEPSTEVSGIPPISDVAPRKTYKRMIGRRVVEYDAATHEPVDPDQTMPIRRVKD